MFISYREKGINLTKIANLVHLRYIFLGGIMTEIKLRSKQTSLFLL